MTNFEKKCKALKLELHRRCRDVMIKKNNASDFNLRKSFLAGRHFELQQILEMMKFVKIKRVERGWRKRLKN